MPHSSMLSTEMQRCVDDCLECHSICLETIEHCLQKGGNHADPKHIRLLRDCAEICQTTANFMLAGPDLHGRTCAVCAEACQRCAESCEQLANDDMMKQCVEVCRRCAESCKVLAQPVTV
jgi:hypothetical protein